MKGRSIKRPGGAIPREAGFYGVLPAGRILCYVNAGHNPPLMFTDSKVSELTVGGPPVGLFEDSVYEAATVTVPHNGTVLMYTDGVVEARNTHDEEFGLERLIDVCAGAYRDVERLPAIVMAAVLRKRRRCWSIWSGIWLSLGLTGCFTGDNYRTRLYRMRYK